MMRRSSEKADQKENEQIQLEDLTWDHGDDESDKDEAMEENKGSLTLTDDDEDERERQPPKVPHKKIKLSVYTQKEMNQLEAELQKANPDKEFVKKVMDTTFLQRRSWIQVESPSVNEILIKCPIFKKSRYVSIDVH